MNEPSNRADLDEMEDDSTEMDEETRRAVNEMLDQFEGTQVWELRGDNDA